MSPKKKLKKIREIIGELPNAEDVYPFRAMLDIIDEPETKKGPDKFAPTHEAYIFAELLFIIIRSRKPNFRMPNLQKWAADVDKINRIDKRTWGQIYDLIIWCQQDSFWQNNILSGEKLRKQLDRLELQMEKDFHWQKNKLQSTQDGDTVLDKYKQSLRENDENNEE